MDGVGVVKGGLGGLGLLAAEVLAEQGGQTIALMSRSGTVRDAHTLGMLL